MNGSDLNSGPGHPWLIDWLDNYAMHAADISQWESSSQNRACSYKPKKMWLYLYEHIDRCSWKKESFIIRVKFKHLTNLFIHFNNANINYFYFMLIAKDFDLDFTS